MTLKSPQKYDHLLTVYNTFFKYYYCYFSSSILYVLQVFSLEDGPGRNVWINLRVPVTVIQTCDKSHNDVDWLKYDLIFLYRLSHLHSLKN